MSGPDPTRVWRRVEGWIAYSVEDARMAHGLLRLDPPAFGGAAYHCQQAAEKILKGFLVWSNTDFRKTHDLEELGEAVLAHFPDIVPLVAPAQLWTLWGIDHRYPGDTGPVEEPSEEELNQALDLIASLTATLRALRPTG